MKPEQRVILYRAGTRLQASRGPEETARDANGRYLVKKDPDAYMTCPECGIPVKKISNKPHRMRRPNNMLNCPFVPAKSE